VGGVASFNGVGNVWAPPPNYSVNRTLTRCAGSRRLPQALDATWKLRAYK